MLEYFLHGNDLDMPNSSHAEEAQDPPTPQVTEGHEEDEEDIDFEEAAIFP